MDERIEQLNNSLLQIDNEYNEVRNKQQYLYKNKIETDYEKAIEREKQQKQLEDIDLSTGNQLKDIEKVQKENEEYLINAKNCKIFINDSFKGAVPFFAKNLILIGAKTGDGKSTTSANISFHSLVQALPVLVITNEENKADVYNRVSCLIKKWSYTNHEQFTKEQRDFLTQNIPKLAQKMTVIDDNFNGAFGQTTTLEGIKNLLESLIIKNVQYGVIIIDYYQNITRSIKNPYMKDWQVQDELGIFLDSFKNKYMSPVVLLAQMKPNGDGKLPFKEAIEGRKSIVNRCTCAIEMRAEKEDLKTAWVIHKSRFNEAIGETVYTGYSKGKFVEYTPEFKNTVESMKASKQQSKLMGMIFKNKKEEEKT